MYMYIFAIFQTVVTKHTKLDAPENGASVFRFVGTLGEEDGDGVILVRCHLLHVRMHFTPAYAFRCI